MKCLLEVEIPPGQTPPTQSSTEQTLLRSQSIYFFPPLILPFVHRLVGNARHFFFPPLPPLLMLGINISPSSQITELRLEKCLPPHVKINVKAKKLSQVAISTTNSFPLPLFCRGSDWIRSRVAISNFQFPFTQP